MQPQEKREGCRTPGALASWLLGSGALPASRALPATVALMGLALALGACSRPVTREALNLLLFPIALSAYLGGLGAGLLALALGAGGLGLLSVLSGAPGQEADPDDIVESVVMLLTGLGIIALIHALLRARQRAAAVPHLEQQISRIAASAPGVLFSALRRPDGTICFPYMSPAYGEIVGVSLEDLAQDGRGFFARVHPDDLPRVLADINASSARLSSYSSEFRIRHPSKGDRWIHARALPQLEAHGGVLWHGFAEDVSARKRAEAALHDSEARYRLLFESSGEGIALCPFSERGLPGRFLQVNETLCRRLGYTREELLAKAPASILEPIPDDEVADHARRLARGEAVALVAVEIARDGRRIPAEVNLRLVTVGGERAVLATSRDVSERQQARAALEQRERRYRALFDLSPAGVLLEDARGNILEANDSLAAMIGVERSALIGRNVRSFVHESEHPRIEEHIGKILSGGTLYHEVENIGGDGEPRYMELRETAVELPDGTSGILAVVADVTVRRRMEEALRESEARYRATLDEMLEGCQIFDPDLRYIYVNESAARQGRRTKATLLGLRVAEAFPGIEATTLHQDMERAVQTGEALRSEHKFTYEDGSFRWFEVHMHPVPEGLFVLSIDVTERREAEELLRQSEERFRLLFDGVAKLAVQGYGPDGTVRFWNRASEQLYGYSAQEVIGRNRVDLLVPPEARDAARAALKQLSEAGANRSAEELQRMRKDGSLVTVFSNRAVVDVAGRGREFYCIDIDLTEQKRAQEGLRLQSAALAAAANAIAIMDSEGIVEWVNPAFTAITGYPFLEAVGRSLEGLLRSNAQSDELSLRIYADIRAGHVWSGDKVNRCKDGSLRTVAVTITPLLDARGAIEHYIVIKQDVTEHRRLEAQLLRTQRLESVGRLASGIAHDLNNILMPMMLGTAVLRPEVKTPAALAVLDSIETSARRGSDIIKQLLVFGRGVEPRRAPLSLRSLAREMMKIIQETFPKNIEVRLSLPEVVPMVEGDLTQLHQVLMNLCVNARDAMPAGGVLSLSLACVPVGEPTASAHAGVTPGRHVLLCVADTGCGIPADALDKIFDPFFSTKAVGEGTGLGLSTVLGIVRGHKGFIEVDSEPGRGAEFRVFLPACAQSEAGGLVADATSPPRGRGETILLVDDEENVRVVTRRMLEHGGYVVLEARHGGEALALLDARPDCAHILLTDVVMPVMDGPALVAAVRTRYPSQKIVSMSGYIAQPGLMQDLERETDAFLSKPFGSQLLLHTMRRVLDEQSAAAPE